MRIGVLGGLLAACLVSLTAFSADAAFYTYPGLQCVKAAGSAGTLEYFAGTVMNTSSTGELQVSCSLPAIEVSGTEGLILQVRGFDRNPSLNVTCALVVEAASGGLIQTWGTAASTAGAHANAQVFNPGMISTLEADKYAWVYCSIPRTSSGNISHVASFRLTN